LSRPAAVLNMRFHCSNHQTLITIKSRPSRENPFPLEYTRIITNLAAILAQITCNLQGLGNNLNQNAVFLCLQRTSDLFQLRHRDQYWVIALDNWHSLCFLFFRHLLAQYEVTLVIDDSYVTRLRFSALPKAGYHIRLCAIGKAPRPRG
jgi:hypothetical protein